MVCCRNGFINKKWSLDLSQHLRLKEDLAVVDNYITQTEVYYKPAKRWKISAQMRYYYRNDNKGGIQGFENMFRYRLGLEKKFKLKPGNFELRGAYQNRSSLDRENRTKKAWRFLFEWKIKNWLLNFILNHRTNDKNRYGVGSKIKFDYRFAIFYLCTKTRRLFTCTFFKICL